MSGVRRAPADGEALSRRRSEAERQASRLDGSALCSSRPGDPTARGHSSWHSPSPVRRLDLSSQLSSGQRLDWNANPGTPSSVVSLPQLPAINVRCARLGKHPQRLRWGCQAAEIGSADLGKAARWCWEPVRAGLPIPTPHPPQSHCLQRGHRVSIQHTRPHPSPALGTGT